MVWWGLRLALHLSRTHTIMNTVRRKPHLLYYRRNKHPFSLSVKEAHTVSSNKSKRSLWWAVSGQHKRKAHCRIMTQSHHVPICAPLCWLHEVGCYMTFTLEAIRKSNLANPKFMFEPWARSVMTVLVILISVSFEKNVLRKVFVCWWPCDKIAHLLLYKTIDLQLRAHKL